MKKFFTEFKAFIKKGNVVDLAVAMIIGTAFNKIVSSLVNDVIMPLVSLMVGGKDVTDWKWIIQKAQYDANGNVLVAETALKYGVFIQAVIDFLIIAFTVFIIVKIFKASTQKLTQIGKTIIAETKELTNNQIKALKKLQKQAKKQAKKEGRSVDEVLEEKSDEIEAITGKTTTESTEQTTEQTTEKVEEKAETTKVEAVKEEQKIEVASEAETSTDAIVEETGKVSKDDEILLVLREIRDSLQSDQK